ncbi:MAG TPA: hypothetical protein VIE63_15125 [Ramlibacter sp.]
MDAVAHERSRQGLDGLVMPRRAAGVALAVGVAAALACGIAGGLLRAGVVVPMGGDTLARAAVAHAALMICAFFGTMIGVERAVAARHLAAWLAPAASAGAGIALLAGAGAVASSLLLGAAVAFLGVNVAILRRQRAAHTALLVVSAACWLLGNAAFALHWPMTAIVPWWFMFLVVTIAAERLEMTRLARRRPGTQGFLFAIIGALAAGAEMSSFAPGAGGMLWGAAMVALAAWFFVFDIARHTIRTPGLPRYMAVCLLAGYAWLGIGGIAWVAQAADAPTRDIALHAIALGFVFSMVMAHAPVILPAITRIKLQFGRVFYVPVLLLHASLVWRLAGPWLDARAFAQGAVANALAIALFATVAAGAAMAWRARHRAA